MKSALKSSPSLLAGHDVPPRPSRERSTSFPSSSVSLFLQRLAVDPRTTDNKPYSQRKVSPTRRRLVKRYSANLPHKMDHVDGQVGHDKPKDPAKRVVQNDHSPPPSRPLPPSRSTSYSKRHASFDSPSEVPLPSSHLSQYFPFPNTSSHGPKSSLSSQGQGTDSTATAQNKNYPVFDDDGTKSGSDTGGSSPSPPTSPMPSSPSLHHAQPNGTIHNERINCPHMESTGEFSRTQDTPRPRDQPHTQTPDFSSPGPVFPFSRPYSLPHGHSDSYGAEEPIQSPKPNKPVWPDRTSSASLPLPMQTPYYMLPQVATSATLDEGQELGTSAGEAEVSRPRLPRAPSQMNGLVDGDAGSSSQPLARATPSPPPCAPPVPHRLDPSRGSTSYAESVPHPISRSDSAASSVCSYPAPEAPIILTPPPPPTGSGRTVQAPYEPFLCHNAVAEDRHSITVETSTSEYRLIINLPGFRRDAITLATRRRRILHVVADSWEPGGGHFERRVSFGYDADLSQVRAEFDGNTLRVTIPRRFSPVSWSAGT